MKGSAPIRVISFFLLAACGALCQNAPSADKASPPDGPISSEVQRPETRSWQSLPDAPVPVQPPVQSGTGATREIEPDNLTPPPQTSLAAPYQLRFSQNQPNDSFKKYLDFQLPQPDPSYAPPTSSGFLGRASYAASSTFITRTASGRPRLNTAYFLGMLALAAAHTAYRPYWQRTGGAVAGDFGVTMGSNAGLNVFHEFQPAIRNLTPKFINKLEGRFTGSQVPRAPLSPQQ